MFTPRSKWQDFVDEAEKRKGCHEGIEWGRSLGSTNCGSALKQIPHRHWAVWVFEAMYELLDHNLERILFNKFKDYDGSDDRYTVQDVYNHVKRSLSKEQRDEMKRLHPGKLADVTVRAK